MKYRNYTTNSRPLQPQANYNPGFCYACGRELKPKDKKAKKEGKAKRTPLWQWILVIAVIATALYGSTWMGPQ
jgi:hypothetical protein